MHMNLRLIIDVSRVGRVVIVSRLTPVPSLETLDISGWNTNLRIPYLERLSTVLGSQSDAPDRMRINSDVWHETSMGLVITPVTDYNLYNCELSMPISFSLSNSIPDRSRRSRTLFCGHVSNPNFNSSNASTSKHLKKLSMLVPKFDNMCRRRSCVSRIGIKFPFVS